MLLFRMIKDHFSS